jgi:hypothetical protein
VTVNPSSGTPVHRIALLLPAGLALLGGLDAALLLLDLPAPLTAERLEQVHGVLLVLGFIGTLVALERAVALGRLWGLAAPACLGAGGLLLLAPVPPALAGALLTAGAGVLCAVYVPLWRRQEGAPVVVQGLGAVTATGAAVLWTAGVPVPVLLPWLASFVVLTIAGERLELAHVAFLRPVVERVVVALAGAMVLAVLQTLLWPRVGVPALGAVTLALAGWLAAHDVARRTVRSSSLPRFAAACMLAGYAWLAVAGGTWLLGGPATDGPRYDAAVHAVFLGFTLSMIFAHAPVILPAVLRRPLPYSPLMWVPAALLHASLAVRLLAGDAHGLVRAWRAGGLVNIVAVLGFVAVAAGNAVAASRRARAPRYRGPAVPTPVTSGDGAA